MKNFKFHQSLRKRCLTASSLARLAGVGRSHLSQVINGKPGRGGHTRRKIARHLTEEELGLLGWDAEGRVIAVN